MRFFRLKKIDHFLFLQIVKYLSTLTINVLLARSPLNLYDLGQYETFLFLSSTVSFFWVNGIVQNLLAVQPRIVNKINKRNSLYATGAILLLIFSIVSGMVIYLILFQNHTQGLFSLSKIYYLLLFIYSLINPVTFLSDYILLLEKRNKDIVGYGLANLGIPVSIITLPAFAGYGLYWCLAGLLVWTAIKLIYLIYLLKKYSLIRINPSEIKEYLSLSFPLILVSLISGFAAYSDSLLINLNFTSSEFAVFRYGAREFPFFLILANALSASMLSKLSASTALPFHVNEIKEKSRRIILFCFPVAIILLICSKLIYFQLFNIKLLESYRIFDIYLLLIISRFAFPQTILAAMLKNKILMLVSTIELTVNISISILLMSHFGIAGVAWGTVIAFVFEKILLAAIVWSKTGIRPNEYIALRELSIFTGIILTVYVIKIVGN